MPLQVNKQNKALVRQDKEDYKALMRKAGIPVVTDKPDFGAITKQIHAEHEKQKHAMMAHMRRRRDAEVLRQIEAAAHYNAAHEQLHMHGAGKFVIFSSTLPVTLPVTLHMTLPATPFVTILVTLPVTLMLASL